MPLCPEERKFLDAYVYEATHGPPFGGPATRCLAQKGIGYTHLSWLLTAYQRELSKEGTPADGVCNPNPPPSPWENLERVQQRAQELRQELEARERQAALWSQAELEEAKKILARERGQGMTLDEVMRHLHSLESSS